jgi:hypothetical protein
MGKIVSKNKIPFEFLLKLQKDTRRPPAFHRALLYFLFFGLPGFVSTQMNPEPIRPDPNPIYWL